jgi:hypothetical protein
MHAMEQPAATKFLETGIFPPKMNFRPMIFESGLEHLRCMHSQER